MAAVVKLVRDLYLLCIELYGLYLVADFATSIDECPVHEFTSTTIRGYQHELPAVVFACIEELYRTGSSISLTPI